MKKSCQTNHELASLIISDLVNLNVKNFCLGSGSRSSPFALALKNNPMAHTITYYDERSLGFYALGLAKASKTPTCIITTSGSAVANLFPAVMEAYMDNIPLIIITCDRAFEDIDRGMNQTCNQTNFFGNYVEYFKTISSPPHQFDQSVISSTISFGVATSKKHLLPIHLNIPFSEPLINDTQPINFSHSLTRELPTQALLTDESFDYLSDILSTTEKGLIIVGGNCQDDAANSIISLSEKLQYPILADPLSNIREKGTFSTCITHYNQIVHHLGKSGTIDPEVIIFLGGHIISKNIMLWARSLTNTHQILVTEKKRHIDTTLSINTRIQMPLSDFANNLNEKTKRKESNLYLSIWKSHSLTIETSIDDFFDDAEKLYEPMCATSLIPIMQTSIFPIFFGNSLPIRYCDNFLFPKKISQKIYGNRGVSGIDGNLSTALGICKSLNTPLVAIVGDCTFLHDVGALNLMQKENIPLIIIVINNDGGGIFNFLPYSDQKNLLNDFISPPTDLNIGNIATSFNIPFWKADTSNDYTKMIEHLVSEKSPGIIEIPSEKKENLKIHQKLDAAILKALSKSVKKERFSYFTLPKKEKSYASTDS
ncbi:MAG: 2-succinyl-5-enolpyruvyl-6-hydroxy-3-cyclohexene-1-carboxylate synthase [Chlamydiia bacterium]|nr:2-succinyl-5-enolpyruvyl-6-hydroxy-3-cyclohexene-1-carboxylate synthase [Chlamydiia bacterium]